MFTKGRLMRNKEAKKIISVLMMFVAALSVCACGKTEVIVDPLPTEELRIEEVREESVDISADAEKIRISEIMIKIYGITSLIFI